MKKLKELITSSYILSYLVMLIYRLINRGVKKEIVRRESLSLFSYKELADNLSYYPLFAIKDNNLYGLGAVMQDKISLDFNKTLIEHGLIFGSLVQKHSIRSYAINIVTFSEYRKKNISKVCEKNIITVGPYIKYADSLFNCEKLDILKKELGKVLLVFPSHSIGGVDAKYDIYEFCKEIELRAGNFNNILICLYWKDIELGFGNIYEKFGFKIVTAGHSYDYNFLRRLKTILTLSDQVMTNNVGTHLIYSVFLEKPCYIYQQEVLSISKNKEDKNIIQRDKEALDTYKKDVNLLINAFGVYSSKISCSQRELINYFGGK